MSIEKPFPIQKSDITYGADTVYRLLDDLFSEGVVAVGDFKVSQKAAGANMSVDVAAGSAYVNFDSPYGGKRRVRMTSASNSGTPGAPNTPDWSATFVAADGTNPRIDRVVLQVRDSNLDGGGAFDGVLRVVTGTPTGGATLTNLNGVAAMPSNAILLANILIPSGSTTVTDANIDSTGVGTAVGVDAIRPSAVQIGAVDYPYCRVTKSGVQSLTDSAEAAITWDTEAEDVFELHSTGSNTSRVYVRQNGVYDLSAFGSFATSGTGERMLRFKKNGSTILSAVRVPSATTAEGTLTAQCRLVKGDYVELYARQTSGGNLDFVNTDAYFSVTFVRP